MQVEVIIACTIKMDFPDLTIDVLNLYSHGSTQVVNRL